jgi:hypothetical protein
MPRSVDSLRTGMLAVLRRSDGFASGMSGSIRETESAELPSVWIGVTASVDSGSNEVELLATVHVSASTEGGASNSVKDVQSVFSEPPACDGYVTTFWAVGHSEVRFDEEQSAYRGLARFIAHVRPL